MILNKILKEASEAQAAKKPFLAVFDLDSTLFNLKPRTAAILDAFVAQFAALPPIELLDSDWGLAEPLRRAGVDLDGPLYKAVSAFWKSKFFSNDFLHFDRPISGAVEFVLKLSQAGASIRYLSGRHISGMAKGTLQSLRTHGFPIDQQATELILKPSVEEDDSSFKRQVFDGFVEKWSDIFLFENEPVNINLIQKHFPKVRIVFVDTCHSGQESIPPSLPAIRDFSLELP